jgi:outer membrane receptor protein involved in Fe transport
MKKVCLLSALLLSSQFPVTATCETSATAKPAADELLRGQIVSMEDGAPVSSAVISVFGLATPLRPDENGNYLIELRPRGYDIEVSAPGFVSRTLENISIAAGVVSEITIHLSRRPELQPPSMEEIKVVGAYVPDLAAGISYERDAGSLVDTMDSEQLKRFGGSTAASALGRIAGISLSQGRYVVVRGLNERHATVTLNGSSLPSPDPSRRVVPLDIFPAMVLKAIEVQKTATPNQPADSTGGVVKLKTKTYPREFEGDLSFALGYVENLTGETRTVQPAESRDSIGYGAGDRSLPESARRLQEKDPFGLASAEERIEAGLALNPGAMRNEQQSVDPGISLELGIGDTLARFDSGLDLGYLLSLRYDNSWSQENSERRNYVLGGTNNLVVRDEVDYARTENNIDLGAVLSFGFSWNENQIDSNAFLLRQSQAETNIITGPQGDNRDLTVRSVHRWNEREFTMQQFVGEHEFKSPGGTHLQWDLAISSATLDSPDQRDTVFRATSPENDPDVSFDDIRYSGAQRRFVKVRDDNLSGGLSLDSRLYDGKSTRISLNYGGSYFEREREGETLRFIYSTGGGGLSGFENETRIENVINETTIAEERFLLSTNTLPTDNYGATWEMSAYFVAANVEWHDAWKLQLGARQEDSNLTVDTFVDAPGDAIPLRAVLDESDLFPSLNFSHSVGADVQLRAGFNTSKNRPDFRELSNAEYIDPESGDNYRGNPNLVSAEIENFDLRAEWYISDHENLTLAYFVKEFERPIEKTVSRIGGGGELFSFSNADSGGISGWEIDFRKEFVVSGNTLFISGNASFVDSEVTATVLDQTVRRRMQGQPDSLLNVQLGLDTSMQEYTLAVLHTGESIDSISAGMPPVMREPRTDVDFKYARYLDTERSYKLKAALKNLLDEPYEYTQGGEPFRKYSRGMGVDIGIGIEF